MPSADSAAAEVTLCRTGGEDHDKEIWIGKVVSLAYSEERLRKIMKILKPRKALWDRRQSQRVQLFFTLLRNSPNQA